MHEPAQCPAAPCGGLASWGRTESDGLTTVAANGRRLRRLSHLAPGVVG